MCLSRISANFDQPPFVSDRGEIDLGLSRSLARSLCRVRREGTINQGIAEGFENFKKIISSVHCGTVHCDVPNFKGPKITREEFTFEIKFWNIAS